MTTPVAIVQAKIVDGVGTTTSFSLDQEPKAGSTLILVAIMDQSAFLDSVTGLTGVSWTGSEVQSPDSATITNTWIAENIPSGSGTNVEIAIDVDTAGRYYLYEVSGLVGAPTSVIMDSSAVGDSVSPSSQALTNLIATQVKFVFFAYAQSGTDDFGTVTRPVIPLVDNILVDDYRQEWSGSGKKSTTGIIAGITEAETVDASMSWTDAGSNNGVGTNLFVFGTDAPRPLVVTGLSVSNTIETGGSLVDISGDFGAFMGTAFRVTIGVWADDDPPCLSGIPGQVELIYPLTDSILRCYLPAIPAGGPYHVRVSSEDGSQSGTLYDAITAHVASEKSAIFSFRRWYPPHYAGGPRRISDVN